MEEGLKSCGVFSPQHMRGPFKNMTKKERFLMFFEELKENYTKVSFKKPTVLEVVEVPKASHSILKDIIRLGITATMIYFTTTEYVFAQTLGEKAEELYFGKFIEIAKWLIIGKCGWDTVSKTLKEDFGGAKKSIISAFIMFAVLTGLPWALNEIDSIFRG